MVGDLIVLLQLLTEYGYYSNMLGVATSDAGVGVSSAGRIRQTLKGIIL